MVSQKYKKQQTIMPKALQAYINTPILKILTTLKNYPKNHKGLNISYLKILKKEKN